MKGIAVLVVTIAAIAAEDCPPNWPPEKLMTHDTECDKYYQCVWGKRVEMVCPSNLYFNENTWQCDWPYNVQCGDRNPPGVTTTTSVPPCNTTTTTAPTTTPPPCNTTTTTAPTTTPPPHGNSTTTTSTPTTTPNSVEGEDCPPNWPPEKLIPHDTDCDKYYQCVWGKRVEMPCPSGLYFNENTWQCDWAVNVNCGDKNTPGPTTEPTSTSSPWDTTTTEPSTPPPCNTTTTTQPTVATPEPTTAPSPCDTTTTPAQPTVATPEPTTAPPCNTTAPLAPCSTEPTAPTTTWHPIPTTAITPPPTGFLPNGCPKDPYVHWLFPVPGCCNSFYQCVWGSPVRMNCPPTLHFNARIQVCDYPWDAGCVE